MIQSLKKVVALIAATFAAVSVFAQVTTSSLGGKVIDQNGQPAVGIAVVATHEPSGTVYGAVTNADGRYAIQGMRAGGPYTVEISSIGYKTVTYTDVTLQLAEVYGLDAVIEESTEQLSESIVIAAPTSKFATVEKTGASTNINNRQITEMPTVSRSISDVARLSPYGGNGMSFAGGDGRSSNFTVDGADFNNNFGLNSGLPGGGNPISIDAIEEVQVVVSPYDVRQTNFIGGGVNAITKSGTNTFKGTAYIYHQNENMHGNRIDNEELSPREKDRKTTYGFTLGGPIIKNKLFFFVNYEYVKTPTVANRWRATADGVMDADQYKSRTTLADMEKVSQHLQSKYGYNPGSYTSFPADESNQKILARIDWNINQKNHLSVRYNYTTNKAWNAPNTTSTDVGQRMTYARMSQYSMAFANAMYSMNNNVNTVSVNLNSRISDKLNNEFLFTYSKLDDVRGSNSSEFPFVDIMNGYTMEGNTLHQDLTPYMSFGYELFTWNNAVHNDVYNVKDDLTYYLGNHKIMAGVNWQYQMADNQYMREGTGYYRYRSIDDFINGAAPESVAITYGYGGEDKPAARIRYNKIGIYAQDEWNIIPTFKLTYGLRVDNIVYNNDDLMTNNAILDIDYGGRHIDTGTWPKSNFQFSPRVGFTWDVLGDKSLKVRGGTGIFAGRLPLVYLTNMPSNSGMIQNLQKITTYYDGDKIDMKKSASDLALLNQLKGGLITDKAELLNKLRGLAPDRFPEDISPEKGARPSAIQAVDPDFKMPQVWKSSIAVDYKFPTSFPLSVTGEYIYNKTINGVMMQDWSWKDNAGWSTLNGADNRHIFPENYQYTYEVNGKTRNVPNAYVLSNTHKGYGMTFSFQVNATLFDNLDLMAGYTHTISKEISGMPGSNAASVFTALPSVEGPQFAGLSTSQYVNPDRLFASVSWNQKGNHLSLFYEGMRYGGYSYMYKGDLNGDNFAYDLMYIPTRKDYESGAFRFASAEDAENYFAFADQDKYLSKHEGEYAEAYAAATPFVHTVDIRYAHDFNVRIGNTKNTLQLSFDLMNALNLFNSEWGVAKVGNRSITDSYSNISPLTVKGIDPDGVPVFKSNVNGSMDTWQLGHTYGNCWYMQIGVKYMFN